MASTTSSNNNNNRITPVTVLFFVICLLLLYNTTYLMKLQQSSSEEVLDYLGGAKANFFNYKDNDYQNKKARYMEQQAQIMEERMEELEKKVHSLEKQLFNMSSVSLSSSSSLPSSALPSCVDLMQRRGSPLADGYFITRHTTPHTWTPRYDGSRRFELTSTCTLKRYSSQEAKRCLAGRHLNFIGDSLSRYQYLSLVYFMEYNRYPPRFGLGKKEERPCKFFNEETGEPVCSPRGEPNICMEGDWVEDSARFPQTDPWVHFFRTLGGSDSGGILNGRLECNCVRDSYSNTSAIAENQMYVSSKEEERLPVALSYIRESGWGQNLDPIHGFHFENCSSSGSCRYTKDVYETRLKRANEGDWDWSQLLEDALEKNDGMLYQQLPSVDITIYNRGLWGRLNKPRAAKLFPLLYNWTRSSATTTTNNVDGINVGRCFYKSTTGSPSTAPLTSPKFVENELIDVRNEAFKAGCGYLDFNHITQDFGTLQSSARPWPPKQENGTIWNFFERSTVYWDKVHFMPWVYEEFNNVLLNVLCNNHPL